MSTQRPLRVAKELAGLLALTALAGCGTWAAPVGAVAGIGLGTVPLIQRTPGDAVISVATGRDCSLVRLDKQESYCKPREIAPPPQPYCTRSLGTVDCWTDPRAIRRTPEQVGDAPTLTAQQEADRRKTWLERELGF